MDEEPHLLVLSRPSETRRNRFISSIWVHSATETIPNVGIYDRNTSYIQQGTSPVFARNQEWFFSMTGINNLHLSNRFSGAHLQVFKGPPTGFQEPIYNHLYPSNLFASNSPGFDNIFPNCAQKRCTISTVHSNLTFPSQTFCSERFRDPK